MNEPVERLEDMPLWCAADVTCESCGWRQVSVYPIEADKLECSRCHRMMEAPQLPEERTP